MDQVTLVSILFGVVVGGLALYEKLRLDRIEREARARLDALEARAAGRRPGEA